MNCQGPHDTPKPAQPRSGGSRELCASHYQQQRRHPDRPLEPIRQTGEHTAQVTFRCAPGLKKAAAQAAEAEGIELAEWWRRAGRRALLRALTQEAETVGGYFDDIKPRK